MTESQQAKIKEIYEKAHAEVDALLSPPAAKSLDFGEPWTPSSDGWAQGGDCAATQNEKLLRAIACVNALAGIPNPAAFVRLAKEMANRNLIYPSTYEEFCELARLANELRKAGGA